MTQEYDWSAWDPELEFGPNLAAKLSHEEKLLLRKWVVALRSGEYIQFQGKLRDDADNKHMCCLGVLCDISEKGKWVREKVDSLLEGEIAPIVGYLVDGGGMINQKSVPAALFSQQYSLLHLQSFATMNDTHGWDFNKIADTVEKIFPTMNTDGDDSWDK